MLASFSNFDGSEYDDFVPNEPLDNPQHDRVGDDDGNSDIDIAYLSAAIESIGAAEQLILEECKDDPNVFALLGIPEGSDFERYL